MRSSAASAVRSPTAALLISSALGLCIGGVLLLCVGVSPLEAYETLWDGAVGSSESLSQTALGVAPLLIMALGLIPAIRAGVFTIGSEGSFGVGALSAALIALELPGGSSVVTIPLAALAGIAGGVLWALLPALLRAYVNVDEILTTLSFNFIALYFVAWMINGPVQDEGAAVAQTAVTPENGWLSTFFVGDFADAGLVLALVLVLALIHFDRTPMSYRLRLLGAQAELADIAGANARRLTMTTMLFAGAAAGLAGWLIVATVDHAVYSSIFRYMGYYALMLAVLGSARVIPVVVGATIFGALQTGSDFLQLNLGVSSEFVTVIQAIVLLIMCGPFVARA